MRQKVSMDSVLMGLFVVTLFLLLFYDALGELHPGFDPLFILFSRILGLVLLALIVFCIVGLVLMIGRCLAWSLP
ncbi:hypothetical protein [Methanoculleus sp.]|jgi:hypothetical protein|uniref:hypothetical protein n=2 Tax=Methanoculleus sp. TaxID=90427 RepID=UPI001BD3E82C|nr:hypothetical protein [Methanoculleus sp.]